MKYQNILYATTIVNIINIVSFVYYKYYNAITDSMLDTLPVLTIIIINTIIVITASGEYINESKNDPKKLINKYGHGISCIIISMAILFASIFAFIIITLSMAPKTHAQEQAIVDRLVNCDDYKRCSNIIRCENCKESPVIFYFNEEQISKAIDKYNKEYKK